MNIRYRRFTLLKALLLLAIFTIAPVAFCFKTAQQKNTNGISGEHHRIVVTRTSLNPPLKIKLIKNWRGTVERDKSFLDRDDWLRGLSVRLLNDSGKTVTFLSVELVFRRAEDQQAAPPAVWSLRYGLDPFNYDEDPAPLPEYSPILPGRDLEVFLTDQQYGELKKFLKMAEFPDPIKKLEMRVMKIGFNDGTAWNTGHMLRRDRNNTRRPLRGWSLIDEPQPEASSRTWTGQCEKRTALFLASATILN